MARVVLTGYIMHFVDPQYASGAYHTLEGILMMGFGLLLLNSLCSLAEPVLPGDAGAKAAASRRAVARPAAAPGAGRLTGRGDEPAAGSRCVRPSRHPRIDHDTIHRCVLCAASWPWAWPRRPGSRGSARPSGRPSAGRWRRSPWSWETGSGRTSRSPPTIVERAQTTEYLNRVYENRKQPGLRLTLWINYSVEGTNLRHTPEICLPSGGWNKIESQTRVLAVPCPGRQGRAGHPAGLRPR